jgi:hypothetical protein
MAMISMMAESEWSTPRKVHTELLFFLLSFPQKAIFYSKPRSSSFFIMECAADQRSRPTTNFFYTTSVSPIDKDKLL